MSVALLSIGTELTRGEIENTNASWLCREVVGLGGAVTEMRTIPDDAVAIKATVLVLMQTHDVVVCTGGLGPTTDDITSACVAAALGVDLVRDETIIEVLSARYAKYNAHFSESNRKQADFPRGATVLPNDWGTAPGFSVKHEGATAFFFPGVPREMQPMFARYVVPTLRDRLRTHAAQIKLRTFGASEASVNDQLAGIEERFNVAIGYRAHFPEIEVKPLALRADAKTAEIDARRAADAIRKRLGTLVYGEGDAALPEVVLDTLRARGLSFGLAESCTGGLLAALLTASSCSDVFRGAVVCYDNAVKVDGLGVDAALIAREGAVSVSVATAMARGALHALKCDVALGVTGIAGPSGGTDEKPVGLVHFAVATATGVRVKEVQLRWDRVRNQLAAAYHGLAMVLEGL